MLSFFPRGVLDEILNLIESVSGEFPSYSSIEAMENCSGLLRDISQHELALLGDVISLDGVTSFSHIKKLRNTCKCL